MKDLTKQERNEHYQRALALVGSKYEHDSFVCEILDEPFRLGAISIIAYFPEFNLFKNGGLCAWMHEQTIGEWMRAPNKEKRAEIINEYRVFILQLCIQMTK